MHNIILSRNFSGIVPVIYLLLNDTIRKDVRKMFGNIFCWWNHSDENTTTNNGKILVQYYNNMEPHLKELLNLMGAVYLLFIIFLCATYFNWIYSSELQAVRTGTRKASSKAGNAHAAAPNRFIKGNNRVHPLNVKASNPIAAQRF
jgi:hypothetical protein